MVHKVHRKSTDYDEDHPNAKTVKQMFGGRAPSEITSAPRESEPDLVADMVVRGRNLPADHPAAPLLPLFTTQADASRQSRAAWIDACKQEATAQTVVDIARLTLIRVYNDNIIDIGGARWARRSPSTASPRCAGPAGRPTRTSPRPCPPPGRPNSRSPRRGEARTAGCAPAAGA